MPQDCGRNGKTGKPQRESAKPVTGGQTAMAGCPGNASCPCVAVRDEAGRKAPPLPERPSVGISGPQQPALQMPDDASARALLWPGSGPVALL